MLSFIGLNIPTNILLLDHLYVKCKSVPNTITKIVLIISNINIEFFFLHYSSHIINYIEILIYLID